MFFLLNWIVLIGIWLIGFGIFQLVHYCIYGEYKKCDDDKEDDTRNDRAQEGRMRPNECAIDMRAASDWNNTVPPPIQTQPQVTQENYLYSGVSK